MYNSPARGYLGGLSTVTASDVTATDDLTVTDDGVIGDDLDVVGDLTAGTIVSDAGVSGTVITGTSLDINGSGDISGALTIHGITSMEGDFTANARWLSNSGTVSAQGAAITDLVPTSHGAVNRQFMRISATEASTWNSLSPASQQAWWWTNVGTFNITIVHASGTGSANLTFLCPNSANHVLTPNSSCLIYYDPTSSRNRVVGPVA